MNATIRGRDRAVAFGVLGAVTSGTVALGPLPGGWLTSVFSREWIFLVNLRLGVAIFIGAGPPHTSSSSSSRTAISSARR